MEKKKSPKLQISNEPQLKKVTLMSDSHTKLKELAKYNQRTIKGELKFMINKVYENYRKYNRLPCRQRETFH